MANIQCKMCGGQVELPDGVTTGECPYCGSVTTFPRIDSEQKEHLYTRAEHFRQANNFDKAVASYEALLNLDGEDPEAYWGLLISRYGIEYVEDPATHERVPTCHRVQFDSILADSDYLNALKFSSGYDHEIYEKEAQRISEIQKSILRISAQEKPYDVFICYKEATDAGTRTKDSTLAQDIYYQLTNQGLKVFFSRITLEDKLGQQYEPYIFAALNSAKVMLVIGSKKEYFEAVWVKNEWSRFLALMKKDRSKLLIPCYRDMDPYDIPEELSMFQCQDMSKIGFIQDILRGVMKVVNTGKSEAKSVSSTSSSGPTEATKTMKFISILMEQQDWDKANSYCEKLLLSDPENAELYLLRCLIAHKIPNEVTLKQSSENLRVDKNFQMALKFASPEQKKKLEQLQYHQADNMLELLKNKYSIQELIQAPVPLDSDELFRVAWENASPERKKELRGIQSGQSDYWLNQCMDEYNISQEAHLAWCEEPLTENANFSIALQCALSGQKEHLQKILSAQSDMFLQRCMKMHNVSDLSKLSFVKKTLMYDHNFCKAWKVASAERYNQLKDIADKQTKYLNSFGLRVRTHTKYGALIGLLVGLSIFFLMVMTGNVHSVSEGLAGLVGCEFGCAFHGAIIGLLSSFFRTKQKN